MLMFGNPAFASDVTTKILGVLAGEAYGNVVFLKLAASPTTVPSCQTNTQYSYAFDATTPAGKISLSIALTAQASGKDVYLSGFNSCAVWSGVESLREILVKD